MNNWGDNAIKKVELTKEQYSDLLKSVEETGRSRKKSQGKIDECDFLCGAMAVMEKLNIGCPAWALLLMSESVLEPGSRQKELEAKEKERKNKIEQLSKVIKEIYGWEDEDLKHHIETIIGRS